ncbi:molybdopterin-binding protein [Sporomusa sp.]|uniref:molybdopterin-binding protein n=1 Tax=Sporomusa sp. TaxID=2078658 RepID=UPI002BBB56DB|nr:molybdopterin-binding protein [Sporomusa sp.]HWR05416.1 molybdopterin-binding protein [Sporomusa sp.]
MKLNLLEKTELRVQNVLMKDVNLSDIATSVAQVLELSPEKVLVIDVRQDHFCLDILEKTVSINQIIGKEKLLLEKLGQITGLTISPETFIDSQGIMGLINCDVIESGQIMTRTQAMLTEIEKNVLARALVYSTGFELEQSMIEDTNSPYLCKAMQENGYKTEFGGVIADSKGAISRKIIEAVDRGFGLIITTGGVGAEDKDFSVEALLAVDPAALTPYIVQFEQGTGRHVKDGVRIGIGKVGLTTIVNLPGPHDEVVAATEVLKQYCRAGLVDQAGLATEIARVLREKLQQKWRGHHGKKHH